MKSMLFFVSIIFALQTNAQNLMQSADTIKAPTVYENIYSRALYTDTNNVSSFVIFIKKEVKAHKHLAHAEHVIVLEGKAEMTLNDKTFPIKKGDVIFIPKDSFHSVKTTSKIPLKVLSIQAPYFDGKDRVFKE
ncbi:MAG: cupin domain-containing protein [Bacteroidetes bacterium]|nr:cupin domain-containing protein [Bacteroidota bacterium]